MSLQQLLRDGREDILTRFVRDLERKDLPPPGLSQSVLLDHIPIFLDEISAELARADGARSSLAAHDVSAMAREHGEQRWKIGYDLDAVVREYSVLRSAIVDSARAAQIELSMDDSDLLARYLSVGVAGAISEYTRHRDQQLSARQEDLKFLSEAGALLGSSLDYQSVLARLTRLLVPRLADFCIVRLEGLPVAEAPIAHADHAELESMRAILQSSPAQATADSEAPLVRARESRLVASASLGVEPGLERTAEGRVLLQLRACSWLVVPLPSRTDPVGTITLAWSDSGRHYQHSDLLLAEDLARRAAAAIDNARLYELSMTERARAEGATRAKDEFVAVVSHELRTPLNVIIGWVRLLRGGSLPEKTREHALEVVERNANAQDRLISDLLDISRAITGKVRLDPAQVDVGNLVTLVLEDARFAFEAKRIQLHRELTEEATVIRGDGERLKQIVWNLLLNAIKFTPKDGQIWVSLRHVDSDLELVVRDTGVGIAPDFLPRVFDAFRQSEATTRRQGGLGIGLSITKHLVDLHGGSIEAHSEGLGKGSSFCVRLPVGPLISTTVGVVKVPATIPARKDPAPSAALVGMTALVVDDEQDARELLRIVLESHGMKVHDAGSVREALIKLSNEAINLLISDIGMPDEDGYSLIRQVRTLPSPDQANVPAIALTAFARNEDHTRALLEGFNVYMTKPVEPAELLLTLADLSRHVVRKPTS